MYRHLMVPLDDSPLSVDTVRKAVEFARALGAKVTFLHARGDYGTSSDGALERVISPAEFNEHMAGEARAILSKAEVVAREAGVDHDSVAVTSNRPYEAILEAADARGCDLIFIASHGRRGLKGLVLGSQTQRVLQQTTIPVLVSAVESNLAGRRTDQAIGHDRRRASLARGGDPRPRVPGPRSARRGKAAVVRSAPCDAALHQGLSRGAAPSEGGRVPVPQAARAHVGVRRDARRARAAARHRPAAGGKAGAEHRRATRRIRATVSTNSPRRSRASPRTRCST